jgi:bacillithiol biosynthesis cysteine-adding enzyme BshC
MSDLVFEAQRLVPPDGLAARLVSGNTHGLFPEDTISSRGPGDAVACRPVAAPVGEALHCVSEEARERLVAIREGRGRVVTTGQQPQLFGGPLYVLYKGLTAVRAAAEIERRTGRPCLAVFWVAADDHDWQEVASVDFLDREERLQRLTVAPTRGRAHRSVGPSPLPDLIGSVVGEFLGALETSPTGQAWTAALEEAYVPGRSFTEAFISVAGSWFRDLPIAFLDSAHPELRRSAIPLLSEVIERNDEVREALGLGAMAVEASGFEPQLAHMERAIPLFRDGGLERFRLRAGPDGIQVDSAGEHASEHDLVAEIEAEPGRFSPSAALRPILESWLLPVARTVLGPGEIAYWTQLQPLFDRLDVRMPSVQPRDSWRVIETRVQRLLEKVGISAEEARHPESIRRRILESNRPASVMQRLNDLDERMVREYDALASAVDSELPGLRSAVGKSRKRARDAVRELGSTVDRVVADRQHIVLGQLDRIVAHLYPEGDPQERRITASAFLASHGRRFLDGACHAAEIGRGSGAGPPGSGVAGDPAPE